MSLVTQNTNMKGKVENVGYETPSYVFTSYIELSCAVRRLLRPDNQKYYTQKYGDLSKWDVDNVYDMDYRDISDEDIFICKCCIQLYNLTYNIEQGVVILGHLSV